MLLLRYKTRKLVFRGLVVLYFIAATWLLMFANGYRIQLNPLIVSRTGNILATFEPKNGSVFIDNKLVTTNSPARIRSLFPGTHQISITSDGYLPYERSIRIEPKKTSFVSNIFLLKNGPSKAVSEDISPKTNQTIESEILSLLGKNIKLETTTTSGTRIIIDNKERSRDLGAGVWKILGADKNALALSRIDTGEIQFRDWDTIDTVDTTLPGNSVVASVFESDRSLLAISDFEVWNYVTNKKSAELVYRFSSPIIAVHAVPKTTIIIVSLPDKITAFNLGDHHYIPTILAEGTIIASKISEDGLSLLYSTKEGGVVKNYKRDLY